MSLTRVMILCVAILLVHICIGEALECYSCEGDANSDCAKGVISAMEVVDCPGGALAQCQHTDSRSGSERKFSRGCTKRAVPDLCQLLYQLAAQFPMGLRVFSCNVCSDAKCNTKTTK